MLVSAWHRAKCWAAKVTRRPDLTAGSCVGFGAEKPLWVEEKAGKWQSLPSWAKAELASPAVQA